MNIKKIIYTSLLIFTIFIGTHVSASTSADKDNVLIYTDKTGTARGYDLAWKAANITGTFAQESPIIRKDDAVYVTSLLIDGMPGNKDLFALDAYTGEIITQYPVGPSFGAIIIDGTTLYVGTGGESWRPESTWVGATGVYSFDISDIRNNGFVLNWFHDVPNRVVPNILIDSQNIYFAEFEGTEYIALDRATGNEVWSFTKGNYGAAFELMYGNFIYVANSYLGGDTLYKLNKSDGTEVWNKPIIGKLWDNSLTYSVDDDALFFTSYYDAQHRAVSYDMDGNLLWSQPLNDASLSYTSYHNNSVFFSDLSGWVYSLNSATGVIEWSVQIGTAGNMITDIGSPVIANGYVFIGTKGPGYEEGDAEGGLADSKGRGAFYILDEETGVVVWEYHEDDLGDIMALATVADGMFYNATNAWDVYAFDIGDGTTSDHFVNSYDSNNTFSTETGLTQDKYVELVCVNVADESTCDTSNSYTGRAIEVKVDMDTDVVESVILDNGNYHINVDGSYVYMPMIPASGSVMSTIIKSSGATAYDPTIPHLINVVQDDASILEASYNPTNEKVTLSVDSTTVFDAEIETFSKPFVGATSTLDNTSVVISKTSMNGVTEIVSADMALTESIGDNEVSISRWNTNIKEWTETGTDAANISSHVIDGLIPNKKYILTVDGDSQNIIADAGGEISFDENIGDALHTFILKLYKKSKSGSSVSYTCKDETASNYSQFGRHKQSKCEYGSEEVTAPTIEVTESNPFGGEQCPADLLIHNFMKNGDTNGSYSPYNKGTITEVSILQAHINRLLADEYTEAAGPVDIWFRSLTHLGVKRIQAKLNQLLPDMASLEIDGVVGPYTREAINMSC